MKAQQTDIHIGSKLYRRVPGFSRYVISEDGDLWRYDEEKIRQIKTTFDPKIKGGYTFCGLIRDDPERWSSASIANLVYRTWVGVKFLKFINRSTSLIFKDGNHQNLHYSNLKYSYNGSYKLTKKDVRQIRNLLKMDKYSLKAIGKMYGVSEMQIHRIKTGENWSKNWKSMLPQLPFPIENPKIRRNLRDNYQWTKVEGVKKPFKIIRNPEEPTDNKIVGIVNGWKFSKNHQNITRAWSICITLNNYFFPEIYKKLTQKTVEMNT